MEAAVAEPTVTSTPAVPRTFNLPAIGAFWPDQGGIFAGLMRAQGASFAVALIVAAPGSAGRFESRTWGEYGKTVEGADHSHNGANNTIAMAAADCELAKDIQALDLEGHKDWYLPSQAELQLCRVNIGEHFEQDEWYWSSTQCSPSHAWAQDFEDGRSSIDTKGYELRAVAVRKLVL